MSQDALKKRPEEWVRRVKLIRRVQRPDGSEQTTEEDIEEQDDAMPKGAKRKVTKLVYVTVLPDGNEKVVETDLEETKPGKFRVIRRTVRTITVKDGKRQVADERVEEPHDDKPSSLDKIISGVALAFSPRESQPEDRPDLRPPTAEFIQVSRGALVTFSRNGARPTAALCAFGFGRHSRFALIRRLFVFTSFSAGRKVLLGRETGPQDRRGRRRRPCARVA